MNVVQFTNSLYLGDRACKKIIIDTWSNRIFIQVDVISRVRSQDGNWNFYSDEDIENGCIVFDKVKSIIWSGDGKIPNDMINYLDVTENGDGSFNFTLSVDSVEPNGSNTEVVLQIIGEGIYLIDPKRPDDLIAE